jgi:hypothetical protein
MSEVPLYSSCSDGRVLCRDVDAAQVQGYLAHKNTQPPRTTIGPYCRVLGGGRFLMSEVPLYRSSHWSDGVPKCLGLQLNLSQYRGYSKLRTRTALGPYSRASPRGIGPP